MLRGPRVIHAPVVRGARRVGVRIKSPERSIWCRREKNTMLAYSSRALENSQVHAEGEARHPVEPEGKVLYVVFRGDSSDFNVRILGDKDQLLHGENHSNSNMQEPPLKLTFGLRRGDHHRKPMCFPLVMLSAAQH